MNRLSKSDFKYHIPTKFHQILQMELDEKFHYENIIIECYIITIN